MGAVIALLFFSTNVAGLIGGARILESMAHAGEIPPAVGHRTQSGVPRNALLVVTVGALLALLLGSLSQILDLLVILITVFSSLSVAAVIVLRRTMPDAPRPFRVPLFPITPLVYLAVALWSVVLSVQASGWDPIIAAGVTVAALLVARPLLARKSKHA